MEKMLLFQKEGVRMRAGVGQPARGKLQGGEEEVAKNFTFDSGFPL